MMKTCLQTTVSGRALALAGLVTAGLLASAPPVQAAEPPEPVFGLIGIARGQVARVSVVLCDGSVRTGDGSVRCCDGSVVPGTSDTCEVQLGIVDEAGQPMLDRGGREITATRSIQVGESFSLDLHGTDALAGGGLRRSFRAVVRTNEPPEPGAPNPCKGLVRTLEMIDAFTGRTSFVYAPPPKFVEPPDPGRQ